MTQDELDIRLRRTMRAQVDDLEDLDYTDAIDDAELELGWSLPQTDSFRIDWLRKRATRNLIHFLSIGSARKFRAEGYHLHQKYKHYSSLVVSMDKEFEKAIEDNPHQFAGVDAYKLFGQKIDAGFRTNELGEDITYDSDNIVQITPTENG